MSITGLPSGVAGLGQKIARRRPSIFTASKALQFSKFLNTPPFKIRGIMETTIP